MNITCGGDLYQIWRNYCKNQNIIEIDCFGDDAINTVLLINAQFSY